MRTSYGRKDYRVPSILRLMYLIALKLDTNTYKDVDALGVLTNLYKTSDKRPQNRREYLEHLASVLDGWNR
jgi:hypothetical protein